MKTLFLLFIIPLLSVGQIDKKTNHYVSVGFLDHKTGISMLGYTFTIIQNENNEIFVGLGTSIATNTLVLGLKKYLFRIFIDGYSVISVQNIYGMGGESFKSPVVALGFEKKVWRQIFINIGFNSIIRIYPQRSTELINHPYCNLNIRF